MNYSELFEQLQSSESTDKKTLQQDEVLVKLGMDAAKKAEEKIFGSNMHKLTSNNICNECRYIS